MRDVQRRLFVAMLVFALAPFTTRAQDSAGATADPPPASDQAHASPELVGSLPATAPRLALAHRLIDETEFIEEMKLSSTVRYIKLEPEINAAADKLPEGDRSTFALLFSMDYETAEAARERRMLNEIVVYYATRMNDDELRAAIDFYGSGLGHKLIHTPQNLTPDERDKVRKYLTTQPSMIKLTKVSADYRNSLQARREALNAAFISDFGARFCQSLNSARIKVSYCPTSGLHKSPGMNATSANAPGP